MRSIISPPSYSRLMSGCKGKTNKFQVTSSQKYNLHNVKIDYNPSGKKKTVSMEFVGDKLKRSVIETPKHYIEKDYTNTVVEKTVFKKPFEQKGLTFSQNVMRVALAVKSIFSKTRLQKIAIPSRDEVMAIKTRH